MLQIKKKCKERGIALGDLADKLGLNRITLSRIVNNNSETTTTVLKKIASILEVDVKDLFESESISGFVKIDGVVHEIDSKSDLDNLVNLVKQSNTDN